MANIMASSYEPIRFPFYIRLEAATKYYELYATHDGRNFHVVSGHNRMGNDPIQHVKYHGEYELEAIRKLRNTIKSKLSKEYNLIKVVRGEEEIADIGSEAGLPKQYQQAKQVKTSVSKKKKRKSRFANLK